MKIKSLKLSNYRNYEKLDLSFSDNLNIIYGNNGVGKTNLVEAIYVLSLTKSFRTNNDKYLIKNSELCTKIEGEVEKKFFEIYQVIISKDGKKVIVDNNIVSKISDYITNINIVLLEPDEQTIFSDSPSDRRKLLNIELSQLNKEYIYYLNNYNQVLKQRNTYLKDAYFNANTSREYLDILTDKLIDYGIKINELRNDFINNINNYISNIYNNVFEIGELHIKYKSDFNNKSKNDLIKFYKDNYKRELNLGKTLYGIHHDDLIFLLDNKDICIYGSNGQQKNAIFSFKLAEINVIKNIFNETPILILDDLFSALDSKKIKNIFKILDFDIQTFITTTELKYINKKSLNNAKLFKVTDGEVLEV